MTAAECSAPAAACVEYDGQLRCEADCTSSADCGEGADCLSGQCWRSCQTVSDCVQSDWQCRVLMLSSGPSIGTYCVAPCRLTLCSYSQFTYSCGSGTYSASTSFDYSGTTASMTTTVAYSNGHSVSCLGTVATGGCTDDSGASCTW
jgi:hypothetical protein